MTSTIAFEHLNSIRLSNFIVTNLGNGNFPRQFRCRSFFGRFLQALMQRAKLRQTVALMVTVYRDHIADATRVYVLRRDRGRCVYCDRVVGFDFELDHVFPHGFGGPDVRGNLVLSCPECNRAKGDRIDIYWITHALLHLMLKQEDLGWITRSQLTGYAAFATPLFVDMPELDRFIPSSLDYDEDEPEIQPRKYRFEMIRRPVQYAPRRDLQKLVDEARKKIARHGRP